MAITRRRWLGAGVGAMCAALCALGAPAAHGAGFRTCKPVNPYPGSRYDGEDLSRIRARGVSCRTARRVARGAHRKALRITPPAGGIRSFRWRRWEVTGNLRGDVDRYVAKRRGGRRVRWRF